MKMNWIDFEYPNTRYIVEVWYKRGGCGDVAIATVRCKDMPKEKDNQFGFTKCFWSYESARRYARHIADELGIPAIV